MHLRHPGCVGAFGVSLRLWQVVSGSRDVNLELAVGTQTGRVQLVTYPDVEALPRVRG